MIYPEPLYIDRTASTNNDLSDLCLRRAVPDLTCIYTAFQSAGRGQRGNSWESEDGKNLLFSFVVFPSFLEARHQFLLSKITALALQEVLSQYASDITIKWPNDIYWRNKKLCGTLIENDWMGAHVSRSISGTGVNLNQEVFKSTAPNPVSLYQITGNTYEPKAILDRLMERIGHYYGQLKAGNHELISARYFEKLYRKEGMHAYRDAQGTFLARIADITPMGKLVLEDEDGRTREYMFKEVEHILHTP